MPKITILEKRAQSVCTLESVQKNVDVFENHLALSDIAGFCTAFKQNGKRMRLEIKQSYLYFNLCLQYEI